MPNESNTSTQPETINAYPISNWPWQQKPAGINRTLVIY